MGILKDSEGSLVFNGVMQDENIHEQPDFDWRCFVKNLAKQNIEDYFKIVQLAQAMLESGRGTSTLFLKYCNPYGLKYRKEMGSISVPVIYKEDKYCSFLSEEIAVQGYWTFISRGIYKGWERSNTKNAFLAHLIRSGYIEGGGRERALYREKIAKLFPEATHILRVV